MQSATGHTGAEPMLHIPVMLQEVIDALAPKDGGVYVDGTFGAGGYTRGILDAANCKVYAIDRDPDAIERAKKMAAQYEDRLVPMHGCFGDVKNLLSQHGVEQVDGFVMDLGVSSVQIDTPERGFSFRHDGPLDMRMGMDGQSARDVVNTADEKELADIIFHYGEERAARRIARKIVERRREKPIDTTADLAAIVHSVLPMHGGLKTDTATRTFQALRIHVNDEMGEIDRALSAGEAILRNGGRLVVVSFHSLEDGRVKNFLREKSGRLSNPSRHMPDVGQSAAKPVFDVPQQGGVKPTDQETDANPRARSARLRYGIRTEAAI